MCNESYENWTSGFFQIAIELFKAGGHKCLESFTKVFNDILLKDMLPKEWMLS